MYTPEGSRLLRPGFCAHFFGKMMSSARVAGFGSLVLLLILAATRAADVSGGPRDDGLSCFVFSGGHLMQPSQEQDPAVQGMGDALS